MNKTIFYLEYDERNVQESLSFQLTDLGGHAVTFLSKTVDFVVIKAGNNEYRLLPSITPDTHQSSRDYGYKITDKGGQSVKLCY